MADHDWSGIGFLERLIAAIAGSTSAALGVLKLAGGTMTGDITTSTALSVNTALAAVWRGMGPVTRTYTAFGMGATPPSVVTPSWGGKSLLVTGSTTSRICGMFTPVSQTTWAATHRMRIASASDAGTTLSGIGVKISGGTDIYDWTRGTVTNSFYRGHETAGTPGNTAILTNMGFTWSAMDYEIAVPSRASEATAGVVTVKASPDGFATSIALDSISLAPAGTGVVGHNYAGAATGSVGILAELWS